MKIIIAMCLVVVCVLSFITHGQRRQIVELQDKLEAYERTESAWLNYEYMLKNGEAFYINGRLITAAHYK